MAINLEKMHWREFGIGGYKSLVAWKKAKEARNKYYQKRRVKIARTKEEGIAKILEETKEQEQLERDLVTAYKSEHGIDNQYTYKNCKDYNVYLRSKKWAKKKKHIIKTYGGKCEICDSTKELQIHHNTYKNRGMELDDELLILCKDCHNTYHFTNKIGRKRKKPASPKNTFNVYGRSIKPRRYSFCRHCSVCSRDSICSVRGEMRTLMLCETCSEKFKFKLIGEITKHNDKLEIVI